MYPRDKFVKFGLRFCGTACVAEPGLALLCADWGKLFRGIALDSRRPPRGAA